MASAAPASQRDVYLRLADDVIASDRLTIRWNASAFVLLLLAALRLETILPGSFGAIENLGKAIAAGLSTAPALTVLRRMESIRLLNRCKSLLHATSAASPEEQKLTDLILKAVGSRMEGK